MRMRSLERLGHDVLGIDTIEPWLAAGWLQRQAQRRLQRGSVIRTINQKVIAHARAFLPDVVWGEKQEYLTPTTLFELRKLGCRLIHFTPDPYFSLPWKRTSLMDQAMSEFDVLIYCKTYEREAYETLGRPMVYMPLGYSDEVHRPMPRDMRWACDVGFLGGWEPRRQQMLHDVAASGIELKLWGFAWEFLRDGRWTLRRQIVLRQLAGTEKFRFRSDPIIAAAYQGGEIYAEDYARALSGARIGLGFLRQVVPDQHTTRTFEIPACGSLLLADRTDEHQSFFEEGKEAEFFSTSEELIDKLKFYKANEVSRARVASAGLERCRTGAYSYIDRMRKALKDATS